MNGAVVLQSCTSSSSTGSTSSTFWVQLLTWRDVGHQAAGVDRAPSRSARVGASARSAPARPARAASSVGVLGERGGRARGWASRAWPKVRSPAAARRQRRALAGDQRRVGAGRAAHGLGGVVDQDVERALRGDRVGERDDLAPGRAGRCRRCAGGRSQSALSSIAAKRRAASRGKRVVIVVCGAVAQQPQRDVHADLRAPAGEQRAPPGQVGARVAALAWWSAAQAGQSWW